MTNLKYSVWTAEIDELLNVTNNLPKVTETKFVLLHDIDFLM